VVELDLLALLLPEIVDEVLPAHVQPAALALDLFLNASRGREGVVVLPMDVIDAQALAQELALLGLVAFSSLLVYELAVDLDVVVGGLWGLIGSPNLGL
jgi:hypothetical protein